MSAQSGLAFEVHALQRELQAFDLGAHGQASDAVRVLVRAARRITQLAYEVATDAAGAGTTRDEVALARITDACLSDEGRRIEPGDLESAIALIAKRLGPLAAGTDAEISRVQRTLGAIANGPGASGGE
ncbi:MAG TPA: hypothetical protein VHS27_07815 [Gaiellales bacterium]|nr:hypothetical protein [Gaiellales bacterium]